MIQEIVELTKKEINILKQLNHPNIIKFIDAIRSENYLYLVMEFCKDGNLDGLISKNNLSENEILYYFRFIIDAFRYLLSKNILHRDVKPENILLHNNVVKLADFGFSRVVNKEDQ